MKLRQGKCKRYQERKSLFMNNRILKMISGFFLFYCLLLLGTATVLGSSEEELLSTIKERSGSQIIAYWCADFDMDGKKEVFAAVGAEEMDSTLWFASDAEIVHFPNDGYIYCSTWYNPEGICTIDAEQKIFVIEYGGGGSGSRSLCYYIKDGIAIPVQRAGENLRQNAGKEFFIHASAFDALVNDGVGTGHTYKRYYLKWIGDRFQEYVGTEISREELEGYNGAVDILQQAAAEGYSIGTIWKRDNGIINVNLFREEEMGRRNENLTLEYSGDSVVLDVINRGVSEWIQKYSFGGEYEASGLL